MERQTFIVPYTAKDKYGRVIKTGKMRIKNNRSSLEAQVRLEGWCRKHLPGFHTLETGDVTPDNDIFSFFSQWFK